MDNNKRKKPYFVDSFVNKRPRTSCNDKMIEYGAETLETRFNFICRFCLSDSDCLPVFLSDGNINERLQKGIEIIASKVDENDGLPNNICRMCVQSIEDFVDFEANCNRSYEILMKVISGCEYALDESKQSNVEMLTEDEETPHYIDNEDEDVSNSFAEENPNTDYIELAVDDGCHVETLQELTNVCEESNTHAVEESQEKNRVIETENQVHDSSIEQSAIPYMTEEMCDKASNATVVDYCYRNNRKIPIVQCMYCDRTYRGRNTLRKHLKIHFQVKNYTCSFCKRSFSDRTSLRLHEARHSVTKSFKCEHCDRAYYSQTELRQHCATKHESRKYVCVVCNKKFPSKAILHDHALVHKSERPYVCCTCGKSFKRNRNLVRHYRCHEKVQSANQTDSVDRSTNPTVCQYCDNVFKKPSKLLEHMIQSHPEEYEQVREGTYYCSGCSQKFNDLKDFLIHQDVHHLLVITKGDYTVYQCVDCGKQLRYRSLAEKHLQSHTTERRFQCNVEECLKKYKFKVHLNRHMRLAHSDNNMNK